MADSKIEVIQGVYEAFGRGDVPAILAVLTDDIDWAAEAESSAAPWYGVHKGKAEVPKFFEALVGPSKSLCSRRCRSRPTTPTSWL